MRGPRRLVLLLMMVVASVFLASGVAFAVNERGGSGNDTIKGTADTDTLDGQDGDDTISGLGGADKIYGAKGNDYLFGTDEYQSGIEDGTQTVTDGNDVISGGDGSDEIAGASGADELQGGADADAIIDGPLNDAAVDRIFGGAGGDTINAGNVPASKDFIDCGLGTDSVQADSLDDVGPSCENVEVIQQPKTEEAPVGAQSADATPPPAVVSSDPGSIAAAQKGESQGPTASSGDVTAQWYMEYYECQAASKYQGATWCTGIYPYTRQWWGLTVSNTVPTRWIVYYVYYSTRLYYDGYDFLHEYEDTFDWWDTGNGYNWYVYMKTSCYSNCLYSTFVQGSDYYGSSL